MSSLITGSLRRVLPLLLWAAVPCIAVAQDPPLPDTVPQPAQVDTLAADTVDAQPLVRFPAMPLAPGVGFAGGEWVWDRDALLREGAVSLYDLLERVPSIAALRGGVFGQPEAAAAFGGTAGRVEVVVDGFVLDPLGAPSYDLAQIPLVQLREVRVQRRLGLLRILLFTEYPHVEQPYTRVEAGIGEPTGNLFRGQFLVPYVIVGPLGLGIERLESAGSGRDPADVFSGWAKWAWTSGSRGLQLELLRTTLRREGESPWPTDRVRQDIILRGRSALPGGVVAEAYAGRSRFDERLGAAPPDTAAAPRADRESVQAGVRAVFEAPWAVLGGTVRYRDAAQLPQTEALLDADVAFGPLRATAELARASWRDGAATSYSSLHAELGRLLGAAAFAEITRGDRGAPAWDDSLRTTILGSREGWRAGVSLELGSRASGSIAWVSFDQDRSLPFGLPFDSGVAALPTERAAGIEAYGRLVLLPDFLAVESWISDWSEPGGAAYLPVRSWRTALTLHTVPLPSGNLEILGRFDAAQRSSMIAFDQQDEDEPVRIMPSQMTVNGYLQIRVIDVRAFIRWEDILNADPQSLPDRVQGGPRIFYGVKWNLWN